MADLAPGLVELVNGLDPEHVGGKAATLGRLAAAGFPVPAAIVVTEAAVGLSGELRVNVTELTGRLGAGPFAVRSSGAAEDLADASYAGLYESFLNVEPDELSTAVAECFASATTERVRTYRTRQEHGQSTDTEPPETTTSTMAVLVQRMVHADTAGVVFTANPVTGNRDETIVTAVRGLGEHLVSGAATGEEWTVSAGEAVRTRAAYSDRDPVLRPGQALEVAAIATEAAHLLGGPQDIEWAIDSAGLHLLQARPMTALPDPVSWQPPGPGLWMRNFRLGEWLPEAMTPLFADWLLPRIEQGYLDELTTTIGSTVPFRYAAVNGWYYNAAPIPSPRLLAKVMWESRGRAVKILLNALARVGRNPVAADRAVLSELCRTWRTQQLPAYRQLVHDGQRAVDNATKQELISWIDRVGHAAGQYLWYLAIVGGSAWKIEACLARLCRTKLPGVLDRFDGVQALLRGLPGIEPGPPPPHAVQSIDWYRPTVGETESPDPTPEWSAATHGRERLAVERTKAEAACRSALARQPTQRKQFDALLDVAQRYAVIREEQAREFTLGWPLLRRCVHRLAQDLQAAGAIDAIDDVFFLQRTEIDQTAKPDQHPSRARIVAERKALWQRQSRLSPPLTLGAAPRLIGDVIDKAVDTARGGQPIPDGAIIGHPASTGRATGPVHIVNGPEDFATFQTGEILVAKATTPAWTPLFGRAAAIVTDIGSLAAHASLVAREYGIPTVVGTGNATQQLHNGQHITVDGTNGTVTRRP